MLTSSRICEPYCDSVAVSVETSSDPINIDIPSRIRVIKKDPYDSGSANNRAVESLDPKSLLKLENLTRPRLHKTIIPDPSTTAELKPPETWCSFQEARCLWLRLLILIGCYDSELLLYGTECGTVL